MRHDACNRGANVACGLWGLPARPILGQTFSRRPMLRRLRPTTASPASAAPSRARPADAPVAVDQRLSARGSDGPPSRSRAAGASPVAWTPSQQAALDRVRAFLGGQGDAFVLDGAAGTGKTTLLAQVLDDVPGDRAVHLVAPTARAARVLSDKTGRPAATLHSHLYTVEPLKNRPGLRCIRKPNEDDAPTLLVVDEASMVPSRRDPAERLFVAERSLLDDLIDHVRKGPKGSQVLFVGDPRQLPPVREDTSAALCSDTLRTAHGLAVDAARLVEIVRQNDGSPVLEAASRLRVALDASAPLPAVRLPRLHRWREAVPHFLGVTDGATTPYAAVHLAFANKSAQAFNADVRAATGRHADLSNGDLVVLDADAWVQTEAGLGARAETHLGRGTAYTVLDVGGERVERAGLRFVTATLRACEEPRATPFAHRVCLDHLHADGPGLTQEQEHALWADRMGTNSAFRDTPHPKNDEYVGALRLRFAYAMTVHKAQGSEWAHVQVNPWVHATTEGTPEHLRWLYTALTRARDTAHFC